MHTVTKYSQGKRAELSATDINAGVLDQATDVQQPSNEALQRMENEGGIPLPPLQTASLGAYANARDRIRRLLLSRGYQHTKDTNIEEH